MWCPAPPGVRRSDDRGLTPAFLDHVAACVRRALAERDGDVLVFLPGAAEIGATVRRLAGADADVRPLHGRLSPGEQDLALAAGPRRRVVVSTAVAESSLTVPGVRAVVDAGLSREPRTDHRRGLAGLVTVPVSRAAAEQRAGRAGREGPGAVYRCWSQAEHAHLAPHPQPEIATADLTAFALDVATWGTGVAGLALLDPPPDAALAAATGTLRSLGALAEDGSVTERGRAIGRVAADPRLGRALLDGAPVVGARRAAEVVALLAEDVRAPGGDLVAALRGAAARRPGRGRLDRRRPAACRLAAGRAALRLRGEAGLTDDVAVGLVVALAHPDRVARLRPGAAAYLMVSGTGAVLGRGEPALAGLPWLAVADVERRPGARDATVRSAAPLSEDLALEAASRALGRGGRGRVARRSRRRAPGHAARRDRARGRDAPRARPGAGRRRRARGPAPRGAGAAALDRGRHRRCAAGWPSCTGRSGAPGPTSSRRRRCSAGVETWLGPELARVRGARDLRRIDVLGALRRLLPWPEAGRLDELAPERVTVPSGSAVRVDYAGRPAGAGGADPGGLRLAGRARAGRRPGAAAPAPALPRPAPGRRDRGPGVVLADRLPAGPRRAARALPEARLAGGPRRRAAPPRRTTPRLSAQAPTLDPA